MCSTFYSSIQNIIFKFYKSKRESRNENRLTISFRLASRIETLNETMSNKKTYKNIPERSEIRSYSIFSPLQTSSNNRGKKKYENLKVRDPSLSSPISISNPPPVIGPLRSYKGIKSLLGIKIPGARRTFLHAPWPFLPSLVAES